MKDFFLRIIEIFAAIMSLIFLFPFFLIAAIIAKIDSPGEMIFHQARVGHNGRVFTLFKLRTMRKSANGAFPKHTQVNDPRFSPICRLIRATGIDEVPQLWNIIKGDMKFIGPRPELSEVVKTYTPEQQEILKYRPGLFGISQLVLREGVDYRKKLKIENAYYPHRNFIKNMMILTFTPFVLISHTFGRVAPFWKCKTEYTKSSWFKFLMSFNGTNPLADDMTESCPHPHNEEKVHAQTARQ